MQFNLCGCDCNVTFIFAVVTIKTLFINFSLLLGATCSYARLHSIFLTRQYM